MGNSGDSLELETRVVKTSDDPARVPFLLEQRDKMARLYRVAPANFPMVYAGPPNGYSMEHLQEYLWVDGHYSVFMVYKALEPLWAATDRVLLDQHHDWDPTLTQELMGNGPDIPDFVLTEQPRPTHGDATLANAMMRWGLGGVVMTDPYPAGGKVPSFRSVDHAAMIQSLCGWEVMMEEREAQPALGMMYCFADLSDEDLRRAMYWLAFKAVRIELREKTHDDPRPEILKWCEIVEIQALEIAQTGENKWKSRA